MPRHAQEKTAVEHRIPVTAIRENVPVMMLAGIAFGASYGHIVKLCHDHGQHGWVEFAAAGCVDLLCILGAEERQRDKRISRPRTGKWVSWPTVVLVIGIILTLAANVATAEKGLLGYFVAALPAGALLLAVSVLERRASFEAPVSTKTARRQSRPASTGPVPAAAAPVPAAVAPVPAASTEAPAADVAAPGTGQASAALLDDARAFRAELAGAGERVTKDKLRVRFGIGSKPALDLLRALKEDDRDESEAVI